VEIIAMADNATPLSFLDLYCSGSITAYSTEKITLNVCYDAGDAINAYSFTQWSTWVVIDQEGRIVWRVDDNTDPAMMDLAKVEIEGLLP